MISPLLQRLLCTGSPQAMWSKRAVDRGAGENKRIWCQLVDDWSVVWKPEAFGQPPFPERLSAT